MTSVDPNDRKRPVLGSPFGHLGGRKRTTEEGIRGPALDRDWRFHDDIKRHHRDALGDPLLDPRVGR